MSGLPPPNILSYTGLVSVPSINRTFPPTTEFTDFNVPTVWVDTLHENAYILVSKALGVADWVMIGGTPGNLETITTPDSTVVVPSAGNIDFLNGTGFNITGSGSNITFSADAMTITAGTGLTGGGTLNLGGTVTLSLTAPVTVADGGTGDSSFTAYMPIVGGTTTTGALQSVADGTAGYVLTYNSSSSIPTWQANPGLGSFTSVNIQEFTASGTYTPTTGMVYCIVELVGGGGGGGGKESSGGATGGAGGGEYARGVFSASTVGASQSVTIGSGGTAGTDSTGADGTNGGTTSFGTLMTALGGGGSAGSSLSAGQPFCGLGGTGGTGGNLHVPGSAGLPCVTYVSGSGLQSGQYVSGAGGGSVLGGFTTSLTTGSGVAGAVAGSNYGGGGGGGASASGAMAGKSGGAGGTGLVVVTEFIA